MERAIEAIPNDAELYKVKGYTLRRAGRYAESIAALSRAHELDPRSPLAATTQAETALLLGRFSESRAWIEEASGSGPEPAWLTVWRGVAAIMERADFDTAIHYLDVAGKMNPGTAYWSWFARLADGRNEEALEASNFEPFIEAQGVVYPPDAMAGITLKITGEANRAAPLLARSRAAMEGQVEDDPDYLRPLCLVTGAQGDLEAAQRYCRQAIEASQKDAFEMASVHWEVVQGLTMAGDRDGALDVMEASLAYPSRIRATVLRADPFLASLREHPRFEPLLERIDQVEPLE